jgi:hypothetical protein
MNTVLNFLIIALVILMMVRTINRLKRQPASATPTTRACPHCLSTIPIRATRCAHCLGVPGRVVVLDLAAPGVEEGEVWSGG